MPSISKTQLDEFKATIAIQEQQIDQERERRIILQRQVESFDEILKKIEHAALGRPLVEVQDSYAINGSSYYPGFDRYRMTDEKLREAEINGLREHIIHLERRLAAAVAVTQFARSHKA